MAELLKGAPVAASVTERLKAKTADLKSLGVTPCLFVARAGAREADIAYEKSLEKRCESIGISLCKEVFPADVSKEKFRASLYAAGENKNVHGVLLFRPLPEHLSEKDIFEAVRPEKDVDGITARSMAGVFSGDFSGFPPCTAQACMEILKHYDIKLAGARVTVAGRSLVTGKPLALMLMRENATVTVCHTQTRDLAAECRRADVLVVAAGKKNTVGVEHLSPGQIVIDVGINTDEKGSICGDVDFEAACSIVSAVTPVPGGVGSVTTAVLAAHTTEAACRAAGIM